jgi:hypothetical protein
MKIKSPDKWKTVITWGAVAASSLVLGYFLYRIPRPPLIKYAALGFTAFIEITMCFALGTAFAYWRRGEGRDRTIAKCLFAFWGTYVFIGLIGAVALFMSEIQSTATVAETVKQTSARNETGYNQALADERYWDNRMRIEDRTGQKAKWERAKVEKDAATARRLKYETALNSEAQETPDDIKGGLDQLFGKIWMYLLIAVFTIIMLVPYVAQLIAAWEIPLESRKGFGNNAITSKTPEITPPIAPIERRVLKVVGREKEGLKIDYPDPVSGKKYQPSPGLSPELTVPIEDIQYILKQVSKDEIISQQDPENKPIGEPNTVNIASLLKPEDMPLFMEFIEKLYEGVDDSDIGPGGIALNGIFDVSKKLNISYHRCRGFNGILNRIGAVVTENGVPSRGLWSKSKVIDYITNAMKGGAT